MELSLLAERFYPAGIPVRRWLAHYASVFNTVEVNNTFYRPPEAETFATWRQQTPQQFLIAVKASRFMTHLKRLKKPQDSLGRFFTSAAGLGPKLGPVLYSSRRVFIVTSNGSIRSCRLCRVVPDPRGAWYDT
jgi:uncharacterized protein YecE (DUF72 family)